MKEWEIKEKGTRKELSSVVFFCCYKFLVAWWQPGRLKRASFGRKKEGLR